MAASLKQEAYEHLRTKLFRGELQAGARLSTLALARELAISNMPVREALNQLHAEGLVDRKPNAGCVVRTLSDDELDELYVLRELLEGFAAAECARRASRKDLGELEDICAEMRQLAVDARTTPPEESIELLRRISETDIRFHHTLIRAAGNRWVSRAAENVVPISQMMHMQSLPPDANARWATARNYRIHSTILRIIRQGDPSQARERMEAHVRCGNPLYEIERLQFPGGTTAHRKIPAVRLRRGNAEPNRPRGADCPLSPR